MARLNPALRTAQTKSKPAVVECSSSSDSDYSSSSDGDIPAEPTPRQTRSRTSSNLGLRPAVSNATATSKRKRGTGTTSLRPGKRARTDARSTTAVGDTAREGETEHQVEDETAVDGTVLEMFDSFAKSRGRIRKQGTGVVVGLHSSKDKGMRTQDGQRDGMPLHSKLDTIEESPRLKGRERAISVAGRQASRETVSPRVQGMGEDESRGESEGLGLRDEDTDDELVVGPAPSHIHTPSPELHTDIPHRPPNQQLGIYDFPDEGSELEMQASSKPTKITINGLSARHRGEDRPPRSAEIPLLSVEDSDWGYPVPASKHLKIRRVITAASPRSSSHSLAPRLSVRGVVGTVRRPLRATLGVIGEESDEDGGSNEDRNRGDDEQDEGEGENEARPPISSTTSPRLTVTLSGNAVKAMSKVMGKFGWSGKGDDWYKKLRTDIDANDAPGVTQVGKLLFKYLFQLQSLLNRAPRAPHIAEQSEWLEEHRDTMRKSGSEIGKLINQIREVRLAPLGDSDRRDNTKLELRRATVADLTRYVMPMLVRTLWRCCVLCGTERDEGNIGLAEDLICTAESMPYVRKITNWIRRLQENLEYEIEQRPPAYNDAKKADQAKKSYMGFTKALELWTEKLQEAVDELEERADEEERIADYAQNDQAIREAREREREEELERKQQKWEEVAQSTKWIASQPRPLQEMWRRATGDQRPPSSSSRSSAAGLRRLPAVRFGELPVVVDHEPWKMEDKKWLLDELRRQDRKRGPKNQPSTEEMETWAETLGRGVHEVVQEIELLKQAARDLAVQRGVMVDAWALARAQ